MSLSLCNCRYVSRPLSVWLQVRLCQLGKDFPFPESILEFRQLQGHVSLPANRSRDSEVGKPTALAQYFSEGKPVPVPWLLRGCG